jgi:large subunit ribosomal protein L3
MFMSIGLIGRKVGMTRIYDEKGTSFPVTVVQAEPNVVIQVKSTEKDGYKAIQIGCEDKPERLTSKPLQGHFKKAGVTPKRKLHEFRTEKDYNVGDALKVTEFTVGDFVDVIGTTKGRGFQGVVKRHRMAGQAQTHGSMTHRRVGAIGCRNKPGKIFKNKRMPGHMGQDSRTVQNLEIKQVRGEDNVLLIKGAIPGANGNFIVIRTAKKKAKKA